MSGRLSVALILMVLLGACGGVTRTVPVTRVTVETCPPQPPDTDCPAFPAQGQTLRALLHAWQKDRLDEEGQRWRSSGRLSQAPARP